MNGCGTQKYGTLWERKSGISVKREFAPLLLPTTAFLKTPVRQQTIGIHRFRAGATVLVVFLQISAAQAQHVQWANSVISFSSERSPKKNSARQVLGRPSVCNGAGDSPCAWAPLHDGNEPGRKEQLHVGFASPMKIQQVGVAENFNPGAVSQVVLYDTKGKPHEVWSGAAHKAKDASRIMRIQFVMTTYDVKSVAITLDCDQVEGVNEIDAIGISDLSDPIEGGVNVIPGLEVAARENLGTGVNSPYEEVLPVISPDGKTLYLDRKNHPMNLGSNDNIWVSVIGPNGQWTTAKNIGPPLNTPNGAWVSSITPDGNTMLIGGTYRAPALKLESNGISTLSEGVEVFSAWLSHRTASGWAYPEKVNIKDFYTRHRFVEFCLSSDAKAIIMALERDEGEGGKDLYLSTLEHDGTWSTPKNLGPDVNTAEDEGMPFFAADGTTLYYASRGFCGYGDFDMFMTKRLDNTWKHWSEPQNLGPQLNSPGWDAYYTLPASGEYAYFVSTERSIGQGDIFRVKLPAALRPNAVVLVSGRVIDAKTQKPLEATIHYETLPDAKDVGVAHSNPATGEYKITLPAGATYGFRAEATGYASVNENLSTKELAGYSEIQRDLKLVPIEVGQTVLINNIFFETGKAALTPESSAELDRLVNLLRDKPTLEIRVEGHTDNVGTPALNAKLSADRANAVRTYLTAKGIKKMRLETKGYGETKPVASNETEEGRQKNRRVEFTIMKQ